MWAPDSLRILALCGHYRGHMQRMLPMLQGLAAAGHPPLVMTRQHFQSAVEGVGAVFYDLDREFPLEAVDTESIPFSSRFVTFAGIYAERLIAWAEQLAPDLILYDTFEVAGPLLGRALGIPYVNVCAGHDAEPESTMRSFTASIDVQPSAACRRAIARLRDDYGMPAANPLCYFAQQSPYLNLYCEPPRFISEATRRSYEPIEYIGSLSPAFSAADSAHTDYFDQPARLRVFVSFGTIIWRNFEAVAYAAFATISQALSAMDGVDAVMSLGRWDIGEEKKQRLQKANVRVLDFVDQWAILQSVDVFITHHGLNSTHEAIFHGVPMLAYPFFSDQPGMAKCCEALGLSLPLVEEPFMPLSVKVVQGGIRQIVARRREFAENLARARVWEEEVIAARPQAVKRILALAAESRCEGVT